MLFGTAKSSPSGDHEGGARRPESWTEWLDRNQHETWQMELLLTGFVILLLSQLRGPMYAYLATLQTNMASSNALSTAVYVFGIFVRSVWLITFSSLILGVALRALWISAIGLRSISGEIELEELGYAPVFLAFLQRRLPRYDDYILRLEQLCSSVFGLTFLTGFAALGLVVAILAFQALFLLPLRLLPDLPDDTPVILWVVFGVFLVVLVVTLVAVDFFTGGAIKQVRGMSKVYYPLYRVVGWLTAARLYRPLYYNFIDNKLGRFAVFAIVPYGIILITVANFDGSSFSENLPTPSNYRYAQAGMYADQADQEDVLWARPSIHSQLVTGDVVRLYIPLGGAFTRVSDACDTVAQAYKRLQYVAPNDTTRLTTYKQYIECLAGYLSVTVDTTEVNLDQLMVGAHPVDRSPQLQIFIPVDSLATGTHHISIDRRSRHRRELYVSIPFYKS